MNKIYQVYFVDEWNNAYNVGFFKDLDSAIPGLNDLLKTYNVQLKSGDICEHAGTFGSYFDTYVSDIFYDDEDNDEICGLMIRGFIFDYDKLIEEITHAK